MLKNALFYLLAFVLLIVVALFFGKAYQALVFNTDATQRHNTVYSCFQNLSKQINNAAISNPDLLAAGNLQAGGGLFSADSVSVMKQLNLLKITVRDSTNIAIANKLGTLVKSELSWLLKSNVPDSIINHRATVHIASLHDIDSLIEQGLERTNFLIAFGKTELNETIIKVIFWMAVFILLSGALLIYTTGSFFKQKSSTISKQRELEKSVREISDYKYAIDESSIVAITDQKGIIKYVNNNFCKISKYTFEELIGQDHRIINSGYHPKKFIRNLWVTIANGKIWKGELKNKAKDGTIYWVDTTIVPFLNEAGKPFQYLAIRADVTERKRAEGEILQLNSELDQKVLERTNELLQAKNQLSQTLDRASFLASIADNIQDPVITSDNNSLITRWNHTAEKLLEWKSDEVIGKSTTEILKVIYTGQTREEILTAFEDKGYWQGEVIYHTKSGIPVYVMATASKLRDREGNITGNLVLARDITARKKAEDSIIKANQRFISIFNFSPVAIAITNLPEGRFIHVNDIFCQTTGYKREDLIGKKSVDVKIIGAEARDKLIAQLLDKGGHGTDIEEIIHRPNGETMVVLCTAEKIDIDDQQCLAFALIDITERKKNEAAVNKLNEQLEQRVGERTQKLAESEAFNRGVLNSLSSHIAVVDVNGNIVSVNQAWKKFAIENGDTTLQRTQQGTNYYAVCEKAANEGEATAAKVLKGMKKVMNGTQADFYLEYPCHSPEEQRWFGIRIMKFDTGEPMVVVAHQDITSRKQAEEMVTETLKAKNTILESIGDAFFAVDKDWIVTYWNRIAEVALRVSKQEIVGKNLWEIFSDSIDSKSYEKYHHAIDTNQVIHFEDYYAVLNKWYEISAYPSENGLSVYFKDVTERKEVEDQIRKLNIDLEGKVIKRTEQLASVNKDLESFSYSVAHDLRIPLRAVSGYATMLKEDHNAKLDSEGKRLIFEIETNARRMGILIDDLLVFSKLGRKEIQKSSIEMNQIAEACLYELHLDEDQRKQIIINKLDEVMADPSLIKHVMINLIGNAVKYSSKNEKPRIEISSWKENDYIIFSITDNGVGFDMEFVDKLFGVFQRLHSDEEFEGTGVGLAIVQRIIHRHHGETWAMGKVNEGATFYFSLPVVHST